MFLERRAGRSHRDLRQVCLIGENLMKFKMVQVLLVGAFTVVGGGRVFAQEWAEKMFEKREHDFGIVAKGADTRIRIKFTNLYRDPVHIYSVEKSCGCTEAKLSKDTLASRETGYIEIAMDTRKFSHQKDSAVTIKIDQPQQAEVRIPIHAYIRTDVVLTPGAAEFSTVTQGEEKEFKIDVAYAGRADWKIKSVISKNPNIEAKVVENRRGGGNVNYSLVVKVKQSAPVGEIREQLTLVTDDAGNANVPVLVSARVDPEYLVTPEIVSFGNIGPGERKIVNIVVRGKKPFLIEKLESENSQGVFEVRLPAEPRQTHVVPLTLIAPAEEGAINEQFTLTIAGRTETVNFKAQGKVVGKSTGTSLTGK
jgi:hypothetical protein